MKTLIGTEHVVRTLLEAFESLNTLAGQDVGLDQIVETTRAECEAGAIDALAASMVLLERLRNARIEVDAMMFDVLFSRVLAPPLSHSQPVQEGVANDPD